MSQGNTRYAHRAIYQLVYSSVGMLQTTCPIPSCQGDTLYATDQGPVPWRSTTVKWRQFSQSNHHSTIGTRQTECHEALPSSANDEARCDCTFADDGNASWYSVCRVPMVEWRLDCGNCFHLTVVGLHDTAPGIRYFTELMAWCGFGLACLRVFRSRCFHLTYWSNHRPSGDLRFQGASFPPDSSFFFITLFILFSLILFSLCGWGWGGGGEGGRGGKGGGISRKKHYLLAPPHALRKDWR